MSNRSQAMRLFHALALPAGLALLLVAPYLLRRRRRAWQAAIVLMLALGLFDLLKGLDFEETAVTWAAAAVLARRRQRVPVHHDPITLRSAIWRVPLLGLAGLFAAGARDLGVTGPSVVDARSRVRPATCCSGSRADPLTTIHFAWIPLAVHLIELGTLVCDRLRDLPAARRAAIAAEPDARAPPPPQLVRDHGTDTLSFFKLRADQQYFFADDRRAFVGYRIENGVLLLSGDPVGPRRRVRRACCAELRAFADSARAEARGGRRQRAPVPAVRAARPAHDLPRR